MFQEVCLNITIIRVQSRRGQTATYATWQNAPQFMHYLVIIATFRHFE